MLKKFTNKYGYTYDKRFSFIKYYARAKYYTFYNGAKKYAKLYLNILHLANILL